MTEIPDAARYVDEFSSKVNARRKWYDDWVSHMKREGPGARERIYTRQDPYDRRDPWLDPWELQRFGELIDLFEAQEQVNAMLLAAIDELQRKLEEA